MRSFLCHLLLKLLVKAMNVDPHKHVTIVFTGNDQVEIDDNSGTIVKHQF